jgi:hypothetical protein
MLVHAHASWFLRFLLHLQIYAALMNLWKQPKQAHALAGHLLTSLAYLLMSDSRSIQCTCIPL